jgi:diguanylate cyclase (GGDEF)-like protein/PAS domain S-box-containing protein
MRSIRDISIRSKLIVIIMATCSIVLLLGGLALTARYAATEQQKTANRMSVLAQVVGANSTAALTFNDPLSARDTLSALVAEPSIIEARVYARDGTLFARFTAPGALAPLPGEGDGDGDASIGGLLFGGDALTVTSPIILDGEIIGKVVLDTDLRSLRLGLMSDIGMLTLIILAAGLAALPLSSKLQRIVSEPIARLARTMRQVSQVKDYSLRAEKHGDDEVGTLIDGFNAMLEQISVRDEQLHIAANALENTGDAIAITDARLKIVSVNKAFISMTGFSPAEVSGRRPVMLRSERHAPAFFREVRRRVDASGQWHGEMWGRRKSGEVFPQWLTISRILDPAGRVTHYVFVSNDISQHKRYEERLEYLAHHDALTQLPNRVLFELDLSKALMRAKRRGDKVGLMFIDLDNFKVINDTLGHAVGDELLQTVAARLQGCLRECDVVARQGGDEFTVMLDGLSDARDAATVAGKFIDLLSRPFTLAGREYQVSASIGIACYPQDGKDVSLLMRSADTAMYQAKEMGRNRYRFYAAGDNLRLVPVTDPDQHSASGP